MSRFTKKKYVAKEVLYTFELPTSEQSIVKVLKSKGNNLHEVETADGKHFLASMPPKFRKHIYIRKGCYVVVDPIKEGVKVKGEIAQILLKDQIKYYKEEGVWPEAFCVDESRNSERKSSDSDNSVNSDHTEEVSEKSERKSSNSENNSVNSNHTEEVSENSEKKSCDSQKDSVNSNHTEEVSEKDSVNSNNTEISAESDSDSEDSSDNDDDLFVNTNRPRWQYYSSSDSEED